MRRRGRSPIALSSLLVATLLAATLAWVPLHRPAGAARSASAVPAKAPGGPRDAVILVLDGANPEDFSLVPMPHLRALARRGVTYTRAFVGQELANTPPSHATIGTGLVPAHHGVQGFLWEDPRTHLALDPTATGAVVNGALERVLAAHRVPSLAGRIKAAHPGARVVSVSAHKCYAADAMGTPAADDILCALIYHNRWVAQAVGAHRPPPGAIDNPRWDVPIPPRTAGFGPAVQQWDVGAENRWTARYALWAFHRVRDPRLLMVSLSETDVLGHFATDTRAIRALMREFDALLGQIVDAYRRAGLLGRTDFVVTADHGMSAIHATLPYSVLTRAVAQAGATPVYIEHDTAAAIGIREDRKARAVAVNISRLGGERVDATYYKVRDHGRWSYRLAAARSAVPAPLRSAYRLLMDTVAAASGPDVLAVYAPHVSTRTTVAYGYSWRAGHLGPQWPDQHIPLILAGPGVERGLISSYPARLVDIAPTVEYLLGARRQGLDGVVLADALGGVGPRLRRSQRGRAALLTPVVQALVHRSDRQ